jgi:hypothetical protein
MAVQQIWASTHSLVSSTRVHLCLACVCVCVCVCVCACVRACVHACVRVEMCEGLSSVTALLHGLGPAQWHQVLKASDVPLRLFSAASRHL